ncbi:MAG: hypothetical protein ACM3SX_15370, partial [Deltaproteobacteria bacterium]
MTEFSRRDFLLRAGQVGCALSIVRPRLSNFLRTSPGLDSSTRAALHDGVRVAAQQSAELYSGLRWRMLGPFRGGRVDAVSGVPGR